MATTTDRPLSSPVSTPESDTSLDGHIPKQLRQTRTSLAGRWLLAALLLIALVGGLIAGLPRLVSYASSDMKSTALTSPVTKMKLLITVTEDGNLESAQNVDIKCKIPSTKEMSG